MAVHMQELISPQAAMRLDAVRRVTLHQKKALVERLLPFNFNAWRERKMSCDAVITAHNPVLAIILLKQALGMGLRCVLTSDASDDDWPYDLAGHPNTMTVIAAAVGVPADRYGAKERFLAGLAEEFVSPSAGLVTRIPANLGLMPHSRQHEGEITLTTVPASRASARDPDCEAAWGVLAASLASSQVAVPSKSGRLTVFASRAVLTGFAEGFVPKWIDARAISYDNRHLHALGTAGRVAVTNVDKAKMMVDDIVRSARFEF
ncbi:hypothetical protein [Rhizobium sp. BK176]|uniref:hypothetical protein n=1 Tax=Rhizobium sp. BK176 TaxID=2587071 RepID=UPI002169BFFB|nr:hypothetical protein [Rhizobium sp. BK176]MCS4089486.1 hypothetical protein [Rhizobium sp. BK176]